MKPDLIEVILSKVLIIAAHTDDETLGVGGTICHHLENNDEVFAIAMTNGVGARLDAQDSDSHKRLNAAKKASDILGFQWLKNGDFPDNSLDSVPLINVVRFIEKVKEELDPNIVYTHFPGDLNIDHQIVSRATLTAFRPQVGEKCKEIRYYEVPSATDYGHANTGTNFMPNTYISIDKYWEKKVEALKSYGSEMKAYPHSRSIEGLINLAKYRGNQVGLQFAEAFQVIRKIVQ